MMERENLEQLISKKLDGELSASDQEVLKSALDSSAEGRRAEQAWERVQDVLAEYSESLGEPSAGVRERVLVSAARRSSSARARWTLAAIPALVVVSFGLGLAVGARAWRSPESVASPAVDTTLLETAVNETWRLMPSQVRWIALCEGQLQLDASPLPLTGERGEMLFVSFLLQEGEGAPRPLCLLAVMAGQEAEVSWQERGRWALRCRPVVANGDVKLQLGISLWPDDAGAQAVTLTSEPSLQAGQTIEVASSCVGSKYLRLWAQVRRLTVESIAREGVL